MSKTYTPLPLGGKGAAAARKARLKRQEQMASWVDAPERGTKWIPLGKHKRAIVDESDYDYINQWNWHCNHYGYAVRFVGRTYVSMHRTILNPKAAMECDHIDRNKLNNRRSNLRQCTKVQNQGNRWKSKQGKSSRFKGVSWSKLVNKFVAYGRSGDRTCRIGSFATETDAARAYNNWAAKHFGEFALLNNVKTKPAQLDLWQELGIA